MIVTYFYTYTRLRAKQWECCGMVWQCVYGSLQLRYWHKPQQCPKCDVVQ